jgi:hypothetical protein
MFKKLAHIIISLLLMVSTTGFTITRHYCGDRLEKMAINTQPKSCCTMHGCCHNETSFHQLKENFSAPINVGSNSKPVIQLFTADLFIQWREKSPDNDFYSSVAVIESPPPLRTTTALSLMQTYLI